MTLFILLFFFSIIQSIFGMGLLVFGTPTMLILGWQFSEALSVLLPASLSISLLQLRSSEVPSVRFRRVFFFFSLPALACGLTVNLHYGITFPVEWTLSIIMASYVIIRSLTSVNLFLNTQIKNHIKIMMIIMGFIHGISNLGGSLLSIIASSQNNEKKTIHDNIVFCYAIFATIQLIILYILTPETFAPQMLLYAFFSSAVYLVIGKKTFKAMNQSTYDLLLSIFMAAYSIALAVKAAGYI